MTVFRPENDDDIAFVDASLCFHVEDGVLAGDDGAGGDGDGDGRDGGDAPAIEVKNDYLIRETMVQPDKGNSITRVHEVYL